MFALHATYHTTLQQTPSQLVFGCDTILNVQHNIDWTVIKNHKDKLIKQNNRRENSKRMPHKYRVRDKILIKSDWSSKFQKDPYLGPYWVVSVNKNNGTLRYRKGPVEDSINLCNVVPYHE